VFSSASSFQKICSVLYGEDNEPSGSIMGSFLKHYYGFVREMQDRGIAFTGRISEAIFASNESCLAKERCIPLIPHFEIPLATVI
jgi:hypothetical protein